MYFYRTNFIKPQELVETVGTLLKLPGVTLKAFPRGNQVILEGSEEAIETALDAFAYFDIADAQVYVEAKIVEVTYDNDFEFGLSWLMDRDQQGPNTFFRGGSGTLNPPSFFQSQQPGNLPFQGVGAAFGFVGKEAEKYGLFDLTLQALQLDGTAEILSRPSIVATEGIQAEVRTLQKTPIIQIRNAQSNPGGETLLLETSYIDTKIGLDVKPLFIGDGFVKLEISPTVSTVTGFSVGNGGTSAPIISDRSAKTTITMADGDTFVIGGLYTDSTLKDTAKVPFLERHPRPRGPLHPHARPEGQDRVDLRDHAAHPPQAHRLQDHHAARREGAPRGREGRNLPAEDLVPVTRGPAHSVTRSSTAVRRALVVLGIAAVATGCVSQRPKSVAILEEGALAPPDARAALVGGDRTRRARVPSTAVRRRRAPRRRPRPAPTGRCPR